LFEENEPLRRPCLAVVYITWFKTKKINEWWERGSGIHTNIGRLSSAPNSEDEVKKGQYANGVEV